MSSKYKDAPRFGRTPYSFDKTSKTWVSNIRFGEQRIRKKLAGYAELSDLSDKERDRFLTKRANEAKKEVEKEGPYFRRAQKKNILRKISPLQIEDENKIKAEILADNYRIIKKHLFENAANIKKLNESIDSTPFVYIVQSENYYKIGCTKSFEQRMFNIQTANPRAVLVKALIPTVNLQQARYLENELQEMFSRYRFHGKTEWFNELPEEYLRSAVILMGGLFLDSDYVVRLDNYEVLLEGFDELYGQIKFPNKLARREFKEFLSDKKEVQDLKDDDDKNIL